MPILTVKQAQDEFGAALKSVATTSLFQYTFVLTVASLFTSSEVNEFSVLSLKFSRLAWGLIAPFGASVLNFYIGRNLAYCTTLVRMHPSERRYFRFIARHHAWFLNPYRVICRPYSVGYTFGALPYFLFVMAVEFPATMILDSTPAYRALTNGPAGAWVPFYILGVGANLLLLASTLSLYSRVFALGNALWQGRWSLQRVLRPSERASHFDGGAPSRSGLFPGRGFSASAHSTVESTSRPPAA